MPSLVFKKYCANERKDVVKFREDRSTYTIPVRTLFPDMFSKMFFSEKINREIFDTLLDLKSKNHGKYNKVDTKSASEIERFDLSHNSVMQSCLRKKDMMLDILPCIYQMIHPDVREINI